MKRIGLLQPGAMGASVGAAARSNQHTVLWASQGRSEDTLARAQRANLEDVQTVSALVAASDIILSVCPPHAAGDVAREVVELGFSGLYVECNAISPDRTRDIQRFVEDAGVDYVDGGIIGGPAWSKEAGTHLYLSGPRTYRNSKRAFLAPRRPSISSWCQGACRVPRARGRALGARRLGCSK